MAKKKGLLKRAGNHLKKVGKEFSQTPLARAAQGRHTKGYI